MKTRQSRYKTIKNVSTVRRISRSLTGLQLIGLITPATAAERSTLQTSLDAMFCCWAQQTKYFNIYLQWMRRMMVVMTHE